MLSGKTGGLVGSRTHVKAWGSLVFEARREDMMVSD